MDKGHTILVDTNGTSWTFCFDGTDQAVRSVCSRVNGALRYEIGKTPLLDALAEIAQLEQSGARRVW